MGRTLGIPRSTGPRSSPGAPGGTTGLPGATGSSRAYGCPGAGRGSGCPTFGYSDIARSAMAVMVSEGFTPGLAVMVDPSTTCRPG